MKKGKIVFFVDQISNGGAERVASILANRLSKESYNVLMITFYHDKDKEYELSKFVKKLYVITEDESRIRIINWFKRCKCVRRFLKECNADTVISLAKPTTNVYLMLAQLGLKKKIVLSERSAPQFYPAKQILKILRSITYIMADKIVFQSQGAQDYFCKAIRDKGIIIPNPISCNLPEPYVGIRKKEIVTACRLSKEKNIEMLINAFDKFYQEYPEYTLSIYGDGPNADELKHMASLKCSASNIIFHGFSKNINYNIWNQKVFVLCSNYEGLSNAMLEALAKGIPTICTDSPIGTAREYIKSYQNGILIPVNDTNELVNALKYFEKNPEKSFQMGNEAIKVRKILSEDKIIQEWKCFIEGLKTNSKF